VVKRGCSLKNSKPQWKPNLLIRWLCLTNYWNSKRPFFDVMGNKQHLLCNKKFLKLRYGELQKHSQVFSIMLPLPIDELVTRLLVIIWCSHDIYQFDINSGSWNGTCY
jgi:hypothetical protein